jgi:hypothetical protein
VTTAFPATAFPAIALRHGCAVALSWKSSKTCAAEKEFMTPTMVGIKCVAMTLRTLSGHMYHHAVLEAESRRNVWQHATILETQHISAANLYAVGEHNA